MHFVSSDVLRNAADFAFGDIGFAYAVEEGCFPVVDVGYDTDVPDVVRFVHQIFDLTDHLVSSAHTIHPLK